MGFFRKRKKKLKKLSGFLKAMVRPVVLSLLPIIDGMIDGWKVILLHDIEKVDSKKLVGFLSDRVDALRDNLKKAIEKGLEQKK